MKIYTNEPWAKYIFKNFLSIYPIFSKSKKYNLFYGKKAIENGIIILKGKAVKKILIYNGEKIPIYHVNLSEKIYGDVISCYKDGKSAITLDNEKNIIYINFDILKTSFMMLSCLHENGTPKDNLNRYQAEYSLNEDITYPIVNKYFRLLYILFIKLTKNDYTKNNYKKSYWPNNAQYAVCLTHDVDNIHKWWLKKVLSYTFKKKRFYNVAKSIGKKEYWNFDKIMGLESDYGFRSTFFFLTTRRDEQPRYNINNLKKVIKKLDNNDWEIGLHTGYESYNDFQRISGEKRKLEKIVEHDIQGVRNHYLRFTPPKTWLLQSKAGFRYDTTLGFRDAFGFRSGYCLPYTPYDYINQKSINILELPMNIMDYTLLSKEKPKIAFQNVLLNVKEHNGLLVINWHQSKFGSEEDRSYVELYKYMLSIFKNDGAYVDTCIAVSDYYNKHINFKLE